MSSEKLNEECAVFGVCLTTDDALGFTYNGLLALQHRGQEGAGIAVVCDNNIRCSRGLGLVSDLYNKLSRLPKSKIAIGHTRYSTSGVSSKKNTGPFLTEYLTGRIAVSHNGHITNAEKIKNELRKCGVRFDAKSDSEVASKLMAYCIDIEKDLIKGITIAAERLTGAFSLTIASFEDKLIAVRDPSGYRPLCIGKGENGYAISSESCALDVCGFELVRDVEPGEIVVIENGEIIMQGIKFNNGDTKRGLCIFEYVYFARQDSVIDDLSVFDARYNMGEVLAREIPAEADVVCGVPDSGLDAAAGFASASGLPLVTGFVKNRYIGRSFIFPTQLQRDNAVRLKLNPLSAKISGKKVVLVDDSIVRGTTIEKIVHNLKSVGAKEVHVRISSPPFKYTCGYGTDIDSEDKLIANNLAHDEICSKIGADSLGYISIEGLREACGKCALSFCTSCFTGK